MVIASSLYTISAYESFYRNTVFSEKEGNLQAYLAGTQTLCKSPDHPHKLQAFRNYLQDRFQPLPPSWELRDSSFLQLLLLPRPSYVVWFSSIFWDGCTLKLLFLLFYCLFKHTCSSFIFLIFLNDFFPPTHIISILFRLFLLEKGQLLIHF